MTGGTFYGIFHYTGLPMYGFVFGAFAIYIGFGNNLAGSANIVPLQ